jgi:hypothetical protein
VTGRTVADEGCRGFQRGIVIQATHVADNHGRTVEKFLAGGDVSPRLVDSRMVLLR